MRYQAFISYKHATSSAFAERLELALKAYAKPLWQPPMRIFRDEKYLKPGLDLPQMITDSIEQSEFFIYLASPEAAQSTWVQDELSQWCSRPARLKKLIIVLTQGDIAIEESSKVIDWARTNAIPRTLREFVKKVPYYLDCSRLGGPERQTLLDPDFKQAVNRIVASFRDVDPIEMFGQEIAQHRKNLRNRNLLVSSAVVTLLLAAGGGGIALQQSHQAAAQSRISKASQLASEAVAAAGAQLPQRALLLGAAAAEVTRGAGEGITPQAEQTLRDLLATVGGFGLSGHTGAVDKLFFLPGGAELLSVGEDGQALIWRLDGDGGARGVTELISHWGRILAIQIFEKDRRLRLVTARGHVLLRSLTASPLLASALDLRDFDHDEACATKVTTAQVLQLGSHDGILRIWDLAPKGVSQPVRQKVVADALAGCVFSADGQWLYAAADRQTPVVIYTGARGGRATTRLEGARGGVAVAAFSPKSRQIALALNDGGIRLWGLNADRGTAGRSFRLAGEKNGNLAIAYSRSGHVLAVAGEEGTIELWKVDGAVPVLLGNTTVPFKFYRAMEGQLTFERNDTLLVASDGLRAAAAIPLSSGGVPLGAQVLHNHPRPDDVSGDRATPYAVHPLRPILATAGNDHNAYLWSIEAATLTRRTEPLRGHDRDILALAFSSDGKWLATAGYDRTVRLWPAAPPQWTAVPAVLKFDPADLILNEGVPNPGGGVYLARFISGEDWFESYGEAAAVRLGRMNGRARLAVALSASPDGELSGLDAKEAAWLRLRSSIPYLQRRLIAELHQQEALAAPGPDLTFDVEQDGRALAEAASDGTIRIWDLQRLPSRSTSYRGLAGPITSLCVRTRFGAMAAVNKSGQIAVWRVGAPAAPQFVTELAHLLAGARPLGGSGAATGAAASAGDFDPAPWLKFVAGARWLAVDLKYLLDLGSSPPLAWRLPDGAHEAAAVADCCIMQLFADRFDFWVAGWDSDRPTRLEPKRPIPDVTAYDYNARHRRLALGLLDGRVMVMELDAGGSVVKTGNITSHDFAIHSLALSSDASIVAAGSPTGITMTEVADDLSVIRHIHLKGHRDNIQALRFSPGDSWLVSGGEDNSVHVHPVSAKLVLSLACIVAGRPLSAAEKGRLGAARASGVCGVESRPGASSSSHSMPSERPIRPSIGPTAPL